MTKKETIEQYLSLGLWFALNLDSKEFSTDYFYKVSTKIGKLEDDLMGLGLSKKQIHTLNDHIRRLRASKMEDMTEKEKLFVCKLIFGSGVEYDQAPKSTENDQKTVIFEQSFLPKMTKNTQNDQIGVGLPGTSVGLRPFFSKPLHEEHFKIVLGKSGLTLHPGTKTLHQPYTQPRGNTELDINQIPGLEDLKL